MTKDIKIEGLRLDDTPVVEKRSLALITKNTWTDLEIKSKKTLQDVLEAGADDYSDIKLSEQEEIDVSRVLRKMATGASAFASMRCAGPDCPFAQDCPLQQINKAPIGKSCILEETMFKEAVLNYVSEYEVDPNNFTELGICTELSEIEILQWRLTMTLRRPEHAALVIQQTIGIDPRTHESITQLQVSPIFEQKQKLANRKSKLVKLMVGDRQEKYKKEAALKQNTGEDVSTQMAKVKQQLKDLQQQAHKAYSGEVIDAEIVSPEDLIDQMITDSAANTQKDNTKNTEDK